MAPRRVISRTITLLAVLLLLHSLAAAQEPQLIKLSPPELDDFPQISTYLNVHTQDGEFFSGLEPQDLRLLENDRTITDFTLTQLHPGAQFVVAINPGPSFAIRDSQGVSRYDLVALKLAEWLSDQESLSQDDLSLLTTNGPEITHSNNPSQILRTLQNYDPDARQAIPAFDIFSEALSVAADTSPEEGMGRAVLLVTPPPEREAAALQNLLALANQQNIRIFVWIVTSTELSDSLGVNQLRSLAAQTAGKAFLFSGTETLPEPESYLEALRSTYLLSFISIITSSGTHQLSVEVDMGGQLVRSEPLSFTLEVQPPNPLFITPPLKIERKPPDEDQEIAIDLLPIEQKIDILVEFPDGHPRPLASTRLYVDNTLAVENSEKPFEQFTWDLAGIESSGEYLLRVEAQDTLGLVGSSIELPVTVEVETAPIDLLAAVSDRAPQIIVLVALLAILLAVWGLIVSGRLRPGLSAPIRLPHRAVRREPPTKPVPAQPEQPTRPVNRLLTWTNRIQWPQRRQTSQPLAYLHYLTADGEAASAKPIQIVAPEITLGREAHQSIIQLDDPSIDPLHARIELREESQFWITDQGTAAGTWINYERIPSEGAALHHGDVLHVGKQSFRFLYTRPVKVRKIEITLEDNNH